MLPTLRGRQPENLEQMRNVVARGLDPLLVAPCGYGKGTLITYIVQSAVSMGHPIIFGVRGKSLVEDMSGRVRRLGIEHGVLMGERRRERWHPVQIASVDTLHRMEFLPDAAIFIIDEAHMALSPTWRAVIARGTKARKDKGLSRMVVMGMTATPIRLDGKGLGRKTGGLFDVMVMGPPVSELIANGYLVRSRVLEPPPVEGAKAIKLGNTDNLAAQAAVFDKVKLIGDEIGHYQKHAAGRKGVTFGTDQKHAFHIAEAFRAAGIPWAYVDADTPLGNDDCPVEGTRAAIYRDLDAPTGTLMGVSTVGCASVGWDHPIVSYLGIMRLTGSFGLWHQMMGRGSRIYPGKTDFLIIDHAGNADNHSPDGYFESPIEWSLDGEAVRPGAKRDRQLITCKQSVMNCWCGHKDKHDASGAHWPCYSHFPAGPKQCPYCACPIPRKAREIEVDRKTELGERARPAIQLSLSEEIARIFKTAAPAPPRPVNMESRRKQLDWLLDQAQKNGHKLGSARYKYIARYGEDPPREWMPAEWREEHPEYGDKRDDQN